MKNEISAGGIIVRKRGKGWQVLIVRDMNRMFTFPKGKLEPGEAQRDAAIREIYEEVGLSQVVYLADLPPLTYFYTRGEKIKKMVQYFVYRYDGNQKPIGQVEEGIHDPRWVALSKAHLYIGYPESNIPLLKETISLLQKI